MHVWSFCCFIERSFVLLFLCSCLQVMLITPPPLNERVPLLQYRVVWVQWQLQCWWKIRWSTHKRLWIIKWVVVWTAKAIGSLVQEVLCLNHNKKSKTATQCKTEKGVPCIFKHKVGSHVNIKILQIILYKQRKNKNSILRVQDSLFALTRCVWALVLCYYIRCCFFSYFYLLRCFNMYTAACCLLLSPPSPPSFSTISLLKHS